MKQVSKKAGRKSFSGSFRRTYNVKMWRRFGSALLCAALICTSIGGGLISASAEGDVPADVPAAEESAAAPETEPAESEAVEEEPADAEPVEAETPETEPSESAKPENTEAAETEPAEKDLVYTLHLTHYLRFVVDGENRHVQTEQTIKLTEKDFEDGACDLNRFAYDAEQLMVTEAKPVTLDAFDKDRQGGARIVYAVNSGWKLVPAEESGSKGAALRNVFEGSLEDYEFVPAKVVTFTVNYQYSKTGGLYGISPYASETIQVLAAEEKKDGAKTYVFDFPIKSKEGFRIVLDPSSLDKYLKTQPPANATAEDLQQMLDNGDFNGDVAKHEFYAYQEKNGLTATPDYSIINNKYNNIYSTKYNENWNAARILTVDNEAGYKAQAYCGDKSHVEFQIGDHGANELREPRIKVTMTEEQLNNALENGRTITVNYRRTATWYTAKHWVPEELSGLMEAEIAAKDKLEKDNVTYVLLNQETLQGRVGALTKAAAKTEGSVYEKLTPLPFAQEIIKGVVSIGDINQTSDKDENKPTEINIYYKAAASYRVIFDTDYAYIPRQQVQFNNNVDFTNVADPQRKGYKFDGWQYLKKGKTPEDSDAYEKVPKDSNNKYTLKIDADLLSKAQIKTTDGVPAISLYPKWIPDKTNITVVLWTEDLDGINDVQAIAEGGNVKDDKSDYYSQKYKEYSDDVTSNAPKLNNNTVANSNYSNVGSFTMEVNTDSSLVKSDGENKQLLDNIYSEVKNKFNQSNAKSGGDENSIQPIDFYDYAGFEVMHETNGEMDYSKTTANADGKTMVYVYFTRKIYTLKFHYYGQINGQTKIATSTNGYSYGGADKILDQNGKLNFSYSDGNTINQKSWFNSWMIPTDDFASNMPMPKTITIKAKYGADLRGAWPAARAEEFVKVTDNNGYKPQVVSWATTDGKYRDDAINPGSTHFYEATLMGLYAAMDEEIIGDPEDPDKTHHLIAYWSGQYQVSYYRYNHCFELPGMDVTKYNDVQTVKLRGDSTNIRDVLYLVPVNNPDIEKFGFNDLMRVSYKNNTVQYGVSDGNYYAVRAYKVNDDTTKYYAVGRQVETVSTNAIIKQNPSARTHMTRVNNTADHTDMYNNATDGQTWGGQQIGSKDDPYDLYFYYDRDRYKITYKVAVNKSNSNETEQELGYIELPYGAHVTKEDYAFPLNYTDTNQEKDGDTPKYLWTYPKGADGIALPAVPVCPDRNEHGTKEWNFKGWGLGPAGVNMQWEFNTDTPVPQAQAADDFYIGSDLLLYAIWETPTCNVTFHLNGGTAATYAVNDTVTVQVPANTKFTETDAKIPRPFYSGHKMDGWYKSDANGTIANNAEQFSFDEYITEDIHVAAKWTATTVNTYKYKVYYVTDNPAVADTAKDKIYVNDNQIVADGTDGAKAYSVLERAEHSKSCTPGTTINLTAKEFSGYIPTETNKKLTFGEETDGYCIIFYYDSYTKGSYTVRYVEAGTETETDPTVIQQSVISEEAVNADKAVLTPAKTAVEALKNKGYRLVNRNEDGVTYTKIEEYDKLKWLDSAGTLHDFSVDMTDLLEASAEKTITFLVQPTPYTIKYENADDSPAGADAALAAVTAAENTPVSSADGKNPTLYTVKDAFTLKTPEMVYENGEWYEFSHWSFGSETDKYNPLTVDKGTVGNLTFVAHWKQVDPQPPQKTGSLTVSKNVTGNLGEQDKAFKFTVTLTDAVVNGKYGDMTFTNGVAAFDLKHGESKTATGLPAGVHYKVEESGNEGYTVSSTGAEGAIEENQESKASFTNHKSSGGITPNYTSVTVKKIWKLDDGGKAADSVKAALLKNGVVDKTVTLNEANNWSYTWTGLELGNLWTVQELDVPEGFDSIISSIGTQFTITNDDKPGSPDNPNKPEDPDKPDKPDKPTKPDKPDKPDKPTKPDKPAKPVKPAKPNHSMVPDDAMLAGGGSGSGGASASGTPQTGDSANAALWLIVMGLSSAGLTALFLNKRKKTDRNVN